ncbi:hypothetical protein [Streptomyces sp. NPDC001020]
MPEAIGGGDIRGAGRRGDGAGHTYLRWRNANARHPDVLAAQRKERARIRSEKRLRWGGRPALAA